MHIRKMKNRIILYGAGKIGVSTYYFLKRIHLQHLIYAFCDVNHAEIKEIDSIPVLSYEAVSDEAKRKRYMFIICFNSNDKHIVLNRLKEDKQKYCKTLEEWLHRNFIRTNVILVRDWSLKIIFNCWLIRKHVTGKCNVIEFGKNIEFSKMVTNISGNYNHIILEDDVSVLKTELRIGDNNNVIHIGKRTYVYKASIVAGEGTTITVGSDCLFAQDVTIRSTDGHKIYNMDKSERLNNSRDITIGNHAWLAKGCSILKGTVIGNDVVVATNAIVNKEINKDNCIIGGIPAKVLKEDIVWEY